MGNLGWGCILGCVGQGGEYLGVGMWTDQGVSLL